MTDADVRAVAIRVIERITYPQPIVRDVDRIKIRRIPEAEVLGEISRSGHLTLLVGRDAQEHQVVSATIHEVAHLASPAAFRAHGLDWKRAVVEGAAQIGVDLPNLDKVPKYVVDQILDYRVAQVLGEDAPVPQIRVYPVPHRALGFTLFAPDLVTLPVARQIGQALAWTGSKKYRYYASLPVV